VADELLGMPGRDMQIYFHTFAPENETKISVSGVPQIQETLFDKFC
jgi:hypothetical protein